MLIRNKLTRNSRVQDGLSIKYGVLAVALFVGDSIAITPKLVVSVSVAVGDAGAVAPEFAVSVDCFVLVVAAAYLLLLLLCQ